jgi:hypothetical protein
MTDMRDILKILNESGGEPASAPASELDAKAHIEALARTVHELIFMLTHEAGWTEDCREVHDAQKAMDEANAFLSKPVTEDVDQKPYECWAIIFMREDGTPATRVEYYATREAADLHLNKATSIHGTHSTGNPRWRIAHLVETSDSSVMEEVSEFSWPPIPVERAQQAIDKSRTNAGHLQSQPSDFLTHEEKDAVRAYFMKHGKGTDTFNTTLAKIARNRP